MKLIRILLFPVVPIYFLVTWCRNWLYDNGFKASKTYDLPIICVGNLSTGGTGKTPMVEYLIRIFKDEKRIATLSRGYKRQTKGYVLADEKATAEIIGDEPYQFYYKFKNEILVAVDANRQHGIEKLIAKNAELILLDDAYQHRKVKAGFNILLTAFNDLYANDILLPTGNLREPKSGAKRAHVIVVTKCPENLSNYQKDNIRKILKPLASQKVFFSSISYEEKVYSKNDSLHIKTLPCFTLLTGIANPKTLVDFFKSKNLQFEHLAYADHYDFKPTDIEKLNTKPLIITTEKDFMRLMKYEKLSPILYYLPIKTNIDNGLEFNQLVKNYAL